MFGNKKVNGQFVGYRHLTIVPAEMRIFNMFMNKFFRSQLFIILVGSYRCSVRC